MQNFVFPNLAVSNLVFPIALTLLFVICMPGVLFTLGMRGGLNILHPNFTLPTITIALHTLMFLLGMFILPSVLPFPPAAAPLSNPQLAQ